jgi:hypothetical protein
MITFKINKFNNPKKPLKINLNKIKILLILIFKKKISKKYKPQILKTIIDINIIWKVKNN